MITYLEKYTTGEAGKVVLSYSGSPTVEMIHLLLDLAETRLDLYETNSRAKKRIVNILIEIFQNIFHHQEDFTAFDFNSFIFYLFKADDHYTIVSGNYIRKENAANLTDRINSYTGMKDYELKEVYRDVLGNGSFSEKGGAGLGLMDIIMKSDGNLTHEFFPVDDDKLFFLMEITIKNS